MSKKQILVIDDNPDILRLIVHSLSSEYTVRSCATSEQALTEVESLVPDVILLDIMLPGLSGLELCSLMKSRGLVTGIPLVAVSARTGATNRCQAFEIGFTHYLEKPFDVSELRALVRSILSFKAINQGPILKVGDLTLDQEKRSLTVKETQYLLTPKEFDIIWLFMRNEGRSISREQILAKMEESSLLNSDRCIDNFVSALRKKLTGSAVKIKTHYGHGYELILDEAGISERKENHAKVS